MKHAIISFLLLSSLVSAAGAQVQHEVREGETLFGIARQYETSAAQLIAANNIRSPELLLPGTLLTIPGSYTVVRGDTLFSIARRFEMDVNELRRVNDLRSNTIRIGQTLTVRVANERAGETKPAETDVPSEPPAEPSEEAPSAISVAAAVTEPLSFAEGGVWPVAGPRRPLNGKLPGVMISAEQGSEVVTVTSGRVVYAGPHTSFGNVVFVQSQQGYIYVYGGQERVQVTVGEQVSAGRSIGSVGVTPGENEAALYFSVWRNNQFVDPDSAPRG